MLSSESIPEVEALRGIPQPAKHHPEVDTYVHVRMAFEQALKLTDDPMIHWSVLLHDLGKGTTPADILPRHIDHEERGIPMVLDVCKRFNVPDSWTELALLVCEHHTRCHRATEMSPAGLRRTLRRLDAYEQPERFKRFLVACEADARGRLGLEDRTYENPRILTECLERSQGEKKR